MVYYNIYKELDNGEKVLIQTVIDARNVTFKADSTGDTKYLITKIDDRGESEETLANEIIILSKPQTPILIENVNIAQLQLYPSTYTSNFLVEKSYDGRTWIKIYDGTKTIIDLDTEDKLVFYRYYTYTTNSISNPSNILVYDVTTTQSLSLTVFQKDNNTFTVQWDNSYYLRYRLLVDNIEYGVYDNNTSNIDIPISNPVLNITLEAYKGMQHNTEQTIFSALTIPEKPTIIATKSIGKSIYLSWNYIPFTTYTLKINNEIIFNNEIKNNYWHDVLDFGVYTCELYAINPAGESTPAVVEIITIETPSTPKLTNVVDSNHITSVEIEVIDDIPDDYIVTVSHLNSLLFNMKNKQRKAKLKEKYIKMFSFKNEFEVKYSKDSFLSLASSSVRYELPRPIQPNLDYVCIGETQFGINTYLFTWTTDNSNMAYSIYKNGILMKRFDKNTDSYVMSCLKGDTVCVHSHIGYEEAESNLIYIDKTTSSLIKPKNITIQSIIGKEIILNCNTDIIEDYDYTIIVYKEINGNKVLYKTFYDTEIITFIEDNYGLNTYYIQFKDKYNQVSEYSEPINIEILNKPSNIEFLENYNQIDIVLSPVQKVTSYQLYYFDGNNWLSLDNPISEIIYTLPSLFNNIDIKLKYKAIVDNLGYIYESEISNEFIYTKPKIAFTASVKQLNALPIYSNIIQLSINSVIDKELPDYFDITITKSNGQTITYSKLSYTIYNDIFMFGNSFGLPFGSSTNNYFPLIVNLEELADATIEITGYKGIVSYTIVLDYNYTRIPQQTQLTKVETYYEENNYIYNFEWLLDTNTTQQYYCIENKDTGEIYNKVDTNTFTLTSTTHISNFTIYSYNISGRTDNVVITTPFIDATTAEITNLNKEVQINIKSVDYANKYMLYVDNNIYMESEVPNFNLDKFSGSKDITIRCVYEEDIYSIYGKPTIITYTPNIIEGVYEIIKNIVNDNYRIQLKNDSISKNVKYINIYSVNKNNTINLVKTLDIPIDDFKFVLELTGKEIIPINSIYFELVNGWEVNRTNILSLKSGYFRFGDTEGNFGYPFIS